MRLINQLALLFFALLLAGCRSVPSGMNPFHQKPLPASASLEPPPNPAVPNRINLLDSPRQLYHEVSYPPFLTRQRFIWDGDGLDWRLRFPSRRYAYASASLRRPIDLQAHYRNMRLVFKIRPARATAFLSVALLDRPETGPPALADVWMIDRAPPLGDGWTTVSIPLADFPLGAPADPKVDVASTLPAHEHRALHWGRIQEIRIISPGGRIPADEISIRDLRFQRL